MDWEPRDYIGLFALVCLGLSAILWAFVKLQMIDEDLQRGKHASERDTFAPPKEKNK